MGRTLSMNYPVLRQNKGVLFEYVRKKNTVIRFLSVHSIYPFLLPVLMFIFDRGAFRTYSIKHRYFALVRRSSH